MKTTSIQTRGIDPVIKKKAEIVFKQLGMSNQSAIRLYFNQVAITGKIPFTPSAVDENGFLLTEQQSILSAWNDPAEDSFPSMEAMIEDLHTVNL